MAAHSKLLALGGLMLALVLPLAAAQDSPQAAPCTGGDRDVEIVTRTPPVWPMSAGLLCVEGYVRVEFTVDTSGQTQDLRVTEASAPGVFDKNALDAVAGWQFLPRCKDGQLVDRQASQRIEFKLPEEEAANCPETIPDELLDLTVSIAAIYSAFADALLESGGARVDLAHLQPSLDGDFARIEQLHIDAVNHSVRVLNSEDQRALLRTAGELVNFSRLAADEDFSETRRLADAYAAALERAFDLERRLQQDLVTSARSVRREVGLSDEDWTFVAGRFIRPDIQDEPTLDSARSYLDEIMTLLRLLHERRDGWQPDPNNPFAQIFSDPELEGLANELKTSINRATEDSTTPQLEWLLSWSRL